jgi:large-conductance mechanosensitive channel
MQSWFGLNPLDVILGTVTFSTVALLVFEVLAARSNHRAQQQAERESSQNTNLLEVAALKELRDLLGKDDKPYK